MSKLLVIIFVGLSCCLVFADEPVDIENYRSLTYDELLAEEEQGTMDVQLASLYCEPIGSYGASWSKTIVGYLCNNINSRNYGLRFYGLTARTDCAMSCDRF